MQLSEQRPLSSRRLSTGAGTAGVEIRIAPRVRQVIPTDGEPVSPNEEGSIRRAATDDGFTAGLLCFSGTTLLNEAASRWADLLRLTEIEWLYRVPPDTGDRV